MSKMVLHYRDADQKEHSLELATATVAIGRDAQADIVLDDERVTRIHCEIRFWNGDYVLKDLRSKNGTILNEREVDVAVLHLHDIIKVGPFLLTVQDENYGRLGETQAGEVIKEMNHGKGFNTIMHQIVDEIPSDDTSDA